MNSSFSRRRILGGAALAAGGLLAPAGFAIAAPARPQRPASDGPKRKRALRLAHLTDSHVQPERRAGEGMTACLRHVQALADPPGLILTGGDLVMDAFEADQARTKLQWDLYLKLLGEQCRLPIEHCLGNHDIWGWNKGKSGASGDEPMYGKNWAMDLLGLSKPYRSFDRAGWHFVILDSVTHDGDGYIGRLDDEQFEWLAADLAGVPRTPVIVVSHIPILAACVLAIPDTQTGPDKGWSVPASWMLVDSHRLRGLFAKHANVRLCLSGHIHLLDRVDYNGVTYLCNGAVSGAWWRGKNHECAEGYAVIDLFDDGTFEHQYVEYGWVAEKA